VVLTLARIYPLKGILDLIQTAQLVRRKIPTVKFRILGEVGDDAYYRRCLELASQLGVTDTIEWGSTSSPAAAYRDADLFCLPSISEALPYAVLEAMFSACPVVATDVGGVSEMLGGTGLVVPPKDPQAMADAIASLLSDSAEQTRATLTVRALHRARSLYTIEKCIGRFQEVYDGLSLDSGVAALPAAG
jgi:glycosyltransferase involved in cell wall biosynthesis